MTELGIPEREMELDRIDTNGNYARGNLRFVTRGEPVESKIDGSVRVCPGYWPYSRSVVTRKLSEGMSRDQIILEAQKAVIEKRKHWHIISARLDFMTFEMPDHITVLPYRDI